MAGEVVSRKTPEGESSWDFSDSWRLARKALVRRGDGLAQKWLGGEGCSRLPGWMGPRLGEQTLAVSTSAR